MINLKEEIKLILAKTLYNRFGIDTEPSIEIPPKPEYGDFSSNVSSLLPEGKGISLNESENSVLSDLRKQKKVFKNIVKVGGYINFFINDEYLFTQLKDLIKEGEKFGSCDIGKAKRVLVEFVSTNPTGPINVVNARAAVVGDVLIKLFNFTGYKADAEFYINDAGRQIEMLGISAEKRFEELQGKKVEIPEDGYKGDYIKECIEKFIDDKKIKKMSEEERTEYFKKYVKDEMVRWQKNTLERFGVSFKNWISEKAILEDFSIQDVIDFLRKRGDAYDKDGAIWFTTKKYGDDKDRVLIKQDGTHTYVVSDASYHKDKFNRGYEHLINVWGPDHHGHVMRVKAAIEAFGFNPQNLEIIIVQHVTLVSRGKKEKMSKREGKFITLDSLLDLVDKDAVRFFFLMRKTNAHLDFDVELAKTLSLENPVFYTQYCYARTVNILSFAKERDIIPTNKTKLSLLTEPQEREIVKLILLFPDVVKIAAERRDVHRIPYYLLKLSKTFHSYYQKVRVITEDKELTLARLLLVKAVRQVVKNGLALIGVTAPEKM